MRIKKQFINKGLSIIGLKLHKVPKKPSVLMEFVEKYSIPKNEVFLNSDKNTITLLQINNIEINPFEHLFVLKGYSLIKDLHVFCNAIFSFAQTLEIRIDNYAVKINTWEELFILKEIFIDGIYNLFIPEGERAILIDIGMNVGMTSLFYAKKEEIKAVYSFEPFIETFQFAKINIELNPDVKAKLNIYNYGLGKCDREEYLDYNSEFKGSMGINGLPAHIPINRNNTQKMKILIKDVSKEFENIIKANAKTKIILKVDCEGSEYEIFERLLNSSILNSIDYIMMEWHIKGPLYFIKILREFGFNVISFNGYNPTIGMIYAFNNNNH